MHPKLTHRILREKRHLTEFQDAYRERVAFLLANPAINPMGELGYPDYFYYAGESGGTVKKWGHDTDEEADEIYPLADNDHMPPNQSPDNKFRNFHVLGARGLFAIGATHNSNPTSFPEYSTDSFKKSWTSPHPTNNEENYRQFFGLYPVALRPDTTYYRTYSWSTDEESEYSDLHTVGAKAFLNEILGREYYTDYDLPYSSSLHSGTKIKAQQIQEIRDVVSALVWFPILPKASYIRTKEVTTEDESWEDTVTAFEAEPWGGWTLVNPPTTNNRVRVTLTWESIFKTITAWETKFVFDLSYDLSAYLDWNIMPPVSAKLICSGLNIGGAYADHGYLAKCSETSAEIDLNDSGGSLRKGFCLDGDITSEFGVDDVEFTITYKGITSYPSQGNTYSEELKDYAHFANSGYAGGGEWGSMCFIAVKPNWKYGLD